MMGRPVEELGRTMTAHEVSEWMAVEQAYGLPDAYSSMGMLCAAIHNAFSKNPLTPADFCPILGAEPAQQSTADHARTFATLAANQC
jgi:hypothetical protein